ncbi:hypothetical protein GGF32_005587 [Allomyces javanicus]|nr:hypothetical protein GGF32_005587 [Allomyces javanicus]
MDAPRATRPYFHPLDPHEDERILWQRHPHRHAAATAGAEQPPGPREIRWATSTTAPLAAEHERYAPASWRAHTEPRVLAPRHSYHVEDLEPTAESRPSLAYPGRRPLDLPDFRVAIEDRERMLRMLKADMVRHRARAAHSAETTNPAPRGSRPAYYQSAYHNYLNGVAEELNLDPGMLDRLIESDYSFDEPKLLDALRREASYRMQVETEAYGHPVKRGPAAHVQAAYTKLWRARSASPTPGRGPPPVMPREATGRREQREQRGQRGQVTEWRG